MHLHISAVDSGVPVTEQQERALQMWGLGHIISSQAYKRKTWRNKKADPHLEQEGRS